MLLAFNLIATFKANWPCYYSPIKCVLPTLNQLAIVISLFMPTGTGYQLKLFVKNHVSFSKRGALALVN